MLRLGTALGILSYLSKAQLLPIGLVTSLTPVLQIKPLAVQILLLITQATSHAPTLNWLAIIRLPVGTSLGILSYLSKAQFLPIGLVTSLTPLLQIILLAVQILLLITQATWNAPFLPGLIIPLNIRILKAGHPLPFAVHRHSVELQFPARKIRLLMSA